MGIEGALLALLIAHQGQFSRTLMLEPSGATVAVIVHAKVTGEDRQRTLKMLSKERLETILRERALDGVMLLVGTATAALSDVRVKTRTEGTVELMIYGTIPLAAKLAVQTAVSAEPIDLWVLPGDRPVVRASRGASGGGLKATMGAGDRIRWEMLVEPPSRH